MVSGMGPARRGLDLMGDLRIVFFESIVGAVPWSIVVWTLRPRPVARKRPGTFQDTGALNRFEEVSLVAKVVPWTRGRGHAKVDASDVLTIRQLLRTTTLTYKAIGDLFGISVPLVGFINSGREWGEVDGTDWARPPGRRQEMIREQRAKCCPTCGREWPS